MSRWVLEIRLIEVTEGKPERPDPNNRYNKLPAEPECREVVAEAGLAGSTLTEVGRKAASFLAAEGCGWSPGVPTDYLINPSST